MLFFNPKGIYTARGHGPNPMFATSQLEAIGMAILSQEREAQYRGGEKVKEELNALEMWVQFVLRFMLPYKRAIHCELYWSDVFSTNCFTVLTYAFGVIQKPC